MSCAYSTLAEITDRYLIRRFVSNKKHYANYLTIAADVHYDIFKKTLMEVVSTWLPLRKGNPYNYIEIPNGTEMVYSVLTTDKCGKMVELYYNNEVNIMSKPTSTDCGCSCGCSGICEDLNSMVMQTKYLFTDNGQDYYEKIWLEYCKNGDIIEYREVPTKKYLDTKGDSGDYSGDFNNDYTIQQSSFTNYEIVTEKIQNKICKLETKECGCPTFTEPNKCLIRDHCFPFFGSCCQHPTYCEKELGGINNNGYGEVKLSECGTRIYFIPNFRVHKEGLPDYLMLQARVDSRGAKGMATVPEFAVKAMFAGIDYEAKRYNNQYPAFQKEQAFINYEKELADMIADLNKISFKEISKLQDQEQRW